MKVLVTGATGFVGRNVWPSLEREGHEVVGLTRDAARAHDRWPEREWRQGDVADEERTAAALSGCDGAYYLVHGMAEGRGEFETRELDAARSFARAAARAGVRRIVYLGGIAPYHRVSEHLRSRLRVGEALRQGPVPAIELRASMIVGHGSLSWLMVRDLAARLPAMVLPRWLKSRTQPLAIQDVVAALTAAMGVPVAGGAWFDLPGPETLSGRAILERTAEAMGLRRPIVLEVPVLSPWLSSHWIRFVTRAEWAVAREVVVGLADDMLAADDRFWQFTGRTQRITFGEAARRALAAEREEGPIPGFWGAVERTVARTARARQPA